MGTGDDKPSDSEKDVPTTLKEEDSCENEWWLTSLFPVSHTRFRDTLNRPYLTPGMKSLRLEYAHKYINFDWTKAVFGDEHELFFGGTRIRVWGTINIDGVQDLQVLRGLQSAQKHIGTIFKPTIEQNASDITFVNSPGRISESGIVKMWFKDEGVPYVLLPPSSRDLGIMENLWSSLKTELGYMSSRKPILQQECFDMVKEAWSYVKDRYVDTHLEELYESIGKRLGLCITRNGDLLYR